MLLVLGVFLHLSCCLLSFFLFGGDVFVFVAVDVVFGVAKNNVLLFWVCFLRLIVLMFFVIRVCFFSWGDVLFVFVFCLCLFKYIHARWCVVVFVVVAFVVDCFCVCFVCCVVCVVIELLLVFGSFLNLILFVGYWGDCLSVFVCFCFFVYLYLNVYI